MSTNESEKKGDAKGGKAEQANDAPAPTQVPAHFSLLSNASAILSHESIFFTIGLCCERRLI